MIINGSNVESISVSLGDTFNSLTYVSVQYNRAFMDFVLLLHVYILGL